MLQLQRKISHPLKDVSLTHIPNFFFQTVFLRHCLSSSKGWLTVEMTEKQAPCKYFICSPLLSAYADSLLSSLNPAQYIWVWSSFWILAQRHFTIIEGVVWNAAEGLVLSPPVWDLMGGLGQRKAIVILEQALPCSNFSLQLYMISGAQNRPGRTRVNSKYQTMRKFKSKKCHVSTALQSNHSNELDGVLFWDHHY